jgi:hypothetical protein
MFRRTLLIIWFAACTFAAGDSAFQMFTDFAPRHAGDRQLASVETAAMERVRRYWAVPVFVSSGLLFVSSAALLAQGWRQRGAV